MSESLPHIGVCNNSSCAGPGRATEPGATRVGIPLHRGPSATSRETPRDRMAENKQALPNAMLRDASLHVCTEQVFALGRFPCEPRTGVHDTQRKDKRGHAPSRGEVRHSVLTALALCLQMCSWQLATRIAFSTLTRLHSSRKRRSCRRSADDNCPHNSVLPSNATDGLSADHLHRPGQDGAPPVCTRVFGQCSLEAPAPMRGDATQ